MNKVLVRNVNDPMPTGPKVIRTKLLAIGHIGVVY